MSRRAHVDSIDSLRSFRASLQEYADVVREALVSLQMEVQRGRDWFEQDRLPYWRKEVRKTEESLVEALNRLERKRLSLDATDSPSCHEEEQAVRRNRQRLRYSEGKAITTQRWLHTVRRETDEFQNLLAKLQHLADNELPRALATLGRRIQALEKYASQPAPPPTPSSSTPRGSTGKLNREKP